MSSLLIFIIILPVLILVHEFGHFLAAKLNGIKVEEFGFGYPPRLFFKKIGETIYSLNWLPFGGFVRLFGEEEIEKKGKKSPRAFYSKSIWQKTVVITAGVVGNILLGILCFAFVYTKMGIPTKLDYVKVEGVSPDSPAAEAGIQTGDQIVSINGQKVSALDQFSQLVAENKGKNISLGVVLPDGQNKDYSLTPRENPPAGDGAIGVLISDTGSVFYPWWQMPFRGICYGIKEAVLWGEAIIMGLGLTVKQLFSGIAPEVTGPVGIYQLTSQVAKEGSLTLIEFVGVLSINFGILNILPIPALDGGHLLFVFVSPLIKKEKKRAKIEAAINMAGMAFLVTLMLLITAHDLLRLDIVSRAIGHLCSFWPF